MQTKIMTEKHTKIRAVALAGLMVLSIFGATMTFAGAASAEHGDSTTRGGVSQWDPTGTSASGNVGVGTGSSVVVYQGEDGIDNLVDGGEVTAESYSNDDGDVLELPIPEDQPTGSYSGDGSSDLIVRTPRITDHDVENEDGASVAGGTVPADDNTLTLTADYNFQEVTHLQVVVRRGGEDGIEVTNKVLASGEDALEHDSSGEVSWTVDKSELQTGTQYSITFRSQSSDLRHGAGNQSTTIDVGTDEVELSLDPDETVQGGDVTYTIDGGEEGSYYLAWIGSSDVGDDADAEDVFEATGSTVSDYDHDLGGTPYAVVDIDDGTGVGSIDTTALDTTDVTVYTANVSNSWGESDGTPSDEAAEAELTVNEGDVTLENPTSTYVPGSEVTVNGTTSTGIDDVTLFARDEGEYHRVEVDGQDTIPVSGDEFEEEDVELSDSAGQQGNNILAYPGSYRIALVAGDRGATMTTTQVAQNVSDTHTLRVEGADQFEVTASVVNGQVAVGDNLEIEGSAPGGDEINVSFIGPRGTFDQYSGINIESDGTFEEEDVIIGGNIRDRFRANIVQNLTDRAIPRSFAEDQAEASISDDFSSISKGNVVMSIGHKGRDGEMGDGVDPDVSAGIDIINPDGSYFTTADRDGLVALIYNINTGSYTQGQVAERLLSETAGDTGSDDVSQVINFRYTDPRTTVDNAVGEAGVNGTAEIGSEITVSGTTNRQPGDNTITVEVIEGPSQTDFDLAVTEEWPLTGNWNATLDTEGLQPGTYTVEASDGTSSDIYEFQLSEDVASEDTSTATPTATATETATETATDTPANTTETTTEGQQGPGFGLVAAIVGLLAVALLAARRQG